MSKIIPDLSSTIWILAGGRLLSQIGNSFTLFYAPIFFVNQVGLSATSVGFAIGSGSIVGIAARLVSGILTDSPVCGRKGTLLLSAFISAIADIFLTLTYNFHILMIGNILMGIGIGLYWTPTDTIIADLTTTKKRQEAFAVTMLADNVGMVLGIALGGMVIALFGNYRILFIFDGISFILFFLIIYLAIQETYQDSNKSEFPAFENFLTALRDLRLIVFIFINILFTTYIAQIINTLPLYFINFTQNNLFQIKDISTLFTLYIVFAILLQMPVIRFLKRFNHIQILMMSMLMWGICFLTIWITGNTNHYPFIFGILALLIGAIAQVAYSPSTLALITDLAPNELRGIYFSFYGQAWAIGFIIGPMLGGWILDQSANYVHNYWLIAAASINLGLVSLWYLQKIMKT